MKKIFLITTLILLLQCGAYAITEDIAVKTYTNEKGLWGLKRSEERRVGKECRL